MNQFSKITSLIVIVVLIIFLQLETVGEEISKDTILNESIEKSSKQYSFLLHEISGRKLLPRSYKNNTHIMVDEKDWTSGFFPGSLWLLYELTDRVEFKNSAEIYTQLLDKEQYDHSTHDIGFMLYCSDGNALRLTHESKYRKVLLNAAHSLSTRFNPKVGGIKSWDTKPWSYPIIIDNMMNLELLMWASHETPDNNYKYISTAHANLSLFNHFRPDGSTFHVIDYNPLTGVIIQKRTHQGASDDSSWARGQSWAIYGYTMMYRETGNLDYLKQAQKTALLFLHYPSMPEDGIPFWDYNAPNIPNELRDSSAAAIMCSALFELSDYTSGSDKQVFLDFAWKQLISLSSTNYFSKLGNNGGFLLLHATGHHPKHSELDVPLNYGDYYYLESLVRAKKHIR